MVDMREAWKKVGHMRMDEQSFPFRCFQLDKIDVDAVYNEWCILVKQIEKDGVIRGWHNEM